LSVVAPTGASPTEAAKHPKSGAVQLGMFLCMYLFNNFYSGFLVYSFLNLALLISIPFATAKFGKLVAV
jgi:hypothetical protein